MLGITTGLYRDGDPNDPGDSEPYAEVRLQEGPLVRATYSGQAPPLLTWVELWSNGSSYHVDGSHDLDARVVLNEHFTRCPTTAAGTTTIACDTPWICSISTAGSIAQSAGNGLGVAQMIATGSANRLTSMNKDPEAFSMTAADGLWFHSRFAPSPVTACLYIVGLSTPTGNADQTVIVFDTSDANSTTNYVFYNTKDTSNAAVVTAHTAAATFIDLDIVLAPGSFSACWINGDGPYVNTSNVPTSGDSMAPYSLVLTRDTSAKSLLLDNITVTALNGSIANPADHPLLTS